MRRSRDSRGAPDLLPALEAATEALGFSMGSEPAVGSLLRTLVASRPGGVFLELGTGTGFATAWMLDGMDPSAILWSVDVDAEPLAIAQQHLASDPRVRFVLRDGADFLAEAAPECFDLIFADAWAGKFTHLNEAIAALRIGGLYVIDDLLPQPGWPQDHPAKVDALLVALDAREDLRATKLDWSSGVLVGTRVAR